MKLSEELFLISEFPINLFRDLPKTEIEPSETLNIRARLKKCRIWSTNTKQDFWGSEENLGNSLKSFSLYCNFLWICFEVFQKAKSNILSNWILAQGIIIPNLLNKHKSIFLGKQGWPWNFPSMFFPYWYYLLTCFRVS